MDNLIVFFPGKFQPLHLGHILTIAKLRKEYTTVIVGITSDTIEIYSKEEIRDMLKTIFPNIEVVDIPFKLTRLDDIKKLPYFNILITAENDEVIKWASEHKINCKSISRSSCIGCSGTELRKLWNIN